MANVRCKGVAVITSTWGGRLFFQSFARCATPKRCCYRHHEAKVMKLYLILNQRVCAIKYRPHPIEVLVNLLRSFSLLTRSVAPPARSSPSASAERCRNVVRASRGCHQDRPETVISAISMHMMATTSCCRPRRPVTSGSSASPTRIAPYLHHPLAHGSAGTATSARKRVKAITTFEKRKPFNFSFRSAVYRAILS